MLLLCLCKYLGKYQRVVKSLSSSCLRRSELSSGMAKLEYSTTSSFNLASTHKHTKRKKKLRSRNRNGSCPACLKEAKEKESFFFFFLYEVDRCSHDIGRVGSYSGIMPYHRYWKKFHCIKTYRVNKVCPECFNE